MGAKAFLAGLRHALASSAFAATLSHLVLSCSRILKLGLVLRKLIAEPVFVESIVLDCAIYFELVVRLAPFAMAVEFVYARYCLPLPVVNSSQISCAFFTNSLIFVFLDSSGQGNMSCQPPHLYSSKAKRSRNFYSFSRAFSSGSSFACLPVKILLSSYSRCYWSIRLRFLTEQLSIAKVSVSTAFFVL